MIENRLLQNTVQGDNYPLRVVVPGPCHTSQNYESLHPKYNSSLKCSKVMPPAPFLLAPPLHRPSGENIFLYAPHFYMGIVLKNWEIWAQFQVVRRIFVTIFTEYNLLRFCLILLFSLLTQNSIWNLNFSSLHFLKLESLSKFQGKVSEFTKGTWA